MRQDAGRLLQALWIKACRREGIPPDSKFVVLSDDNPYAVRYNRLMRLVMASKNVGK